MSESDHAREAGGVTKLTRSHLGAETACPVPLKSTAFHTGGEYATSALRHAEYERRERNRPAGNKYVRDHLNNRAAADDAHINVHNGQPGAVGNPCPRGCS